MTRRHGAAKSIAGSGDARRGGADDRLEAPRRVLVVGVGLVPLDHRELGVVLGREALVAEVLAELVDALEAADDRALEVELGRDPQVEVAVERVVVGHERAAPRAAVDRLEDRRLDLDEAVVVERAPHGGDDPRPRDEQLARLLVGDQVELAPAEARLDVGQPVVLVGRRPQRLGEQRERRHAQRELAAARADRHAVDADQVAEVERDEPLEALLAELVDARMQLDAPRAVDEVEERRAPRLAPRRDPPRDAVRDRRLLPGRQPLVRRQHGRDRLDPVEVMRERLNPLRPQALELRPPSGQHITLSRFLRAHGRRLHALSHRETARQRHPKPELRYRRARSPAP